MSKVERSPKQSQCADVEKKTQSTLLLYFGPHELLLASGCFTDQYLKQTGQGPPLRLNSCRTGLKDGREAFVSVFNHYDHDSLNMMTFSTDVRNLSRTRSLFLFLKSFLSGLLIITSLRLFCRPVVKIHIGLR